METIPASRRLRVVASPGPFDVASPLRAVPSAGHVLAVQLLGCDDRAGRGAPGEFDRPGAGRPSSHATAVVGRQLHMGEMHFLGYA